MLGVEHIVTSVALLSVVVILFRLWISKRLSYWKHLKIKYWETNSIFGNYGEVVSLKGNEVDIADKFYHQLGDEKYGGYYFFWKPILMVKDPHLIKRLTITDFQYFSDHPDICNVKESTDTILNSLFFQRGNEWKTRRTVLSHFFTPARVKLVHDAANMNCKQIFDILDKSCKNSEDVAVIEMMSSITMNVILSTFIGVDVKEKTTFQEAAKLFANPSFPQILKIWFYNIHPKISDFFHLTSINKKIYKIFSTFVNEVISAKEEHNAFGSDLCSLLIKAKLGEVKGLEDITHNEMVGHIFSFFIAGHDTTALTAGYALFHLSRDQEIQTELRNQLCRLIEEKGDLSYENLKELPYLNHIMSEAERMYPVLGVIKRVSNKQYQIDENLTIPPGSEIVFPVRAMHYDPQYFQDPDIFNPSRFADSEPPEVFMPFGKGPRICIGKRFSEVVMRIVLSLLIINYQFIPSNKNQFPFKFEASTITTSRPVGGLWVKMKKIENN